MTNPLVSVLITAYNAEPWFREAFSLGDGAGVAGLGVYRKPGVSQPFRPVRDWVGWEPALRLQRCY